MDKNDGRRRRKPKPLPREWWRGQWNGRKFNWLGYPAWRQGSLLVRCCGSSAAVIMLGYLLRRGDWTLIDDVEKQASPYRKQANYTLFSDWHKLGVIETRRVRKTAEVRLSPIGRDLAYSILRFAYTLHMKGMLDASSLAVGLDRLPKTDAPADP